jgi:hypothetical protein
MNTTVDDKIQAISNARESFRVAAVAKVEKKWQKDEFSVV